MIAQTQPSSFATKLRTVLRSNAVFCSFSGLLLALTSGTFSTMLGVGTAWLWPLGFVLFLYGIDLAWLTTKPAWLRPVAWLAIVLDALWVVGSIALMVSGVLHLNSAGWAVMIGTTIIVAAFAEFQWMYVRKLEQ